MEKIAEGIAVKSINCLDKKDRFLVFKSYVTYLKGRIREKNREGWGREIRDREILSLCIGSLVKLAEISVAIPG